MNVLIFFTTMTEYETQNQGIFTDCLRVVRKGQNMDPTPKELIPVYKKKPKIQSSQL